MVLCQQVLPKSCKVVYFFKMFKNLKKINCLVCGKLYSTKHLPVHMRVHTGEKPFVCEFCGQRFAINGNLTKHKKKHHFGEKYKCVDCSCEFGCASSLSRHKSESETKDPFQCRFCCSSFKRMYNLIHHQTKSHKRTDDNHGPDESDGNKVASSMMELRNQKQKKLMEVSDQDATMTSSNSVSRFIVKRKHNEDSPEVNAKTSKQPSTNPSSDLFSNQDNPVTTDVLLEEEQVDCNTSSEIAITSDDNDEGNSNFNDFTIEAEDVNGVNNLHENSSFVLKEPVFKLNPLQNAAEILFITESWKLTKSRHKLEHLKQLFIFGDQVLDFLGGNILDWSLDTLMEFLNLTPQKKIGNFLTALIVLDYCVRSSHQNVFSLYNRTQDSNSEFKSIIEKITLYIAQRKLRQDITSFSEGNSIPCTILNNLKFDFFPLAAKVGNLPSHILTTTESKFLSRVTASITDYLFSDIKCNDITIMDNNFPVLERAHLWITVLNDYMNEWLKGEDSNVLTLVLQSNLRRNDGTLPFFTMQKDNELIQIHLHEQVVKKFSDCKPAECPFIDASQTDVQVFQKLLYKDHKPEEYKGLITYGVYKIAAGLKLRSIEWFLLRNKDYRVYTDNSNKSDILKVLIKLRKTEQINQIASIFNSWMPEKDIRSCLNGMEPEDVTFFLDTRSLNLDELLVVKIALQWAHANCNKEVDDEIKAKFDPDVNESFRLVRHVIRLSELQNHAHLFCQCSYVSMQDIYIAVQLKTKNDKALEENYWFSTTPRESVITNN